MNSGSWWWTGRPGVLRFMESQRVGQDWVTELNWTGLRQFEYLLWGKKKVYIYIYSVPLSVFNWIVWYWVVWVFLKNSLDINPLSDILFANIFFQFSGLPFYFVDGFLCYAEDFKFDVVLLIYFYFCCFCFCCQFQNNYC